MASFTFRRQLTIEWGQCDPAGIVFNSRFFEMFDASTWQMFQAALSVKPHELAGEFGITSRISEFRRSSFDVEHHLSVGGELAVEGGETRVWASRNKDDPEKIGGTTIPADVIARFGSA